MLEKFISGFTKLFGTKSDRDIKKIKPVVDTINSFEHALQSLSDDELKGKTLEFKTRLKEAVSEIEADMQEIRQKLAITGEDDTLTIDERRSMSEELEALDKEWLKTTEEELDEILPEAYAVLKETCRRFVGQSWEVAGNMVNWNMVPYDVQLIGATALHQGKISEMKTGEGKTLVAIFPAYLNALVGRGVHVVTVNNYLSRRDAEWNAPIFAFHGLTVDCVDLHEPNSEMRRKAYRADITYGTNNEFGFDYLRDNMVANPDQLVQRGHHFTIVDEVDSVLIDEARTPLIISGPVPNDNQTQKYEELKPRISNLVEAQKKLVAKLVQEAEELMAAGNDDKAGLALLRAQRGFPKNKKFQKMMQEPAVVRLLQKTEYFYLQENAKNMPFVDEALYYSVDMKNNTIEMTDLGRDYITSSDEEKEFFVIPDMGTETSLIEEELAAKEKAERALIGDDEGKLQALHEELQQERNARLAEKNRLFAERSERIHSVNQLLRAYTMFEKDVEYIVQEGKVMIVDEHTGRVLSGRRYSDGLHQAIEAKESVKVEAATQTYATITLQNYFRMYHKLAGMTGTAITEEGEFFEIYKLEVVEIPTNRPIQRADNEDLVFRSKREKFNAVLDKIRIYHESKQPVLVGTTSVEVSETLSRMLTRAKIPHNVLNAKQHQRESEIVKMAGEPGAVTIATNMAGRGTDIKLGAGVQNFGGLAILGTERHESRRIDLQLRGRSGRQGDPGETQFYVSLEDDLMRLFGGTERVMRIMDRMKFEEGEVIQHPWVTKALERAQKRVEQNNFGIRKRQLEYDDVLNNQRSVIYKRRRNALLGERLTSDLQDMLEDLIASSVEANYRDGNYEQISEDILRLLAVNLDVDRVEWSRLGDEGLIDYIAQQALLVYRQKEKAIAEPLYQALKQLDESKSEQRPSMVEVIFTDGMRYLRVVVNVDKCLETQGHEITRALERTAVLSIIDDKWMEHLRDLDSVKEGIGLRAFGQKDPLLEYKREAFSMFTQLVDEINTDVISMIWKAVPQSSQGRSQQVQRASAPSRGKLDLSRAQASHAETDNMAMRAAISGGNQEALDNTATKQRPVVVEKKMGRNDPCPYDPNKKFKNCCGAKGLTSCNMSGMQS
jgi:preprotein translocase subunit SecA